VAAIFCRNGTTLLDTVATIDSATYGVSDIDTAKQFWTDFGLTLLEENRNRLLF
jgi:hypothetical protein